MIQNAGSIPAGGYKVIFVDKDYAGFTDAEPFARLGLSSSGETLALYDAGGNLVGETVAFPALMKDVAYGRVPSTGDWAYFKTPTPNAENTGTPCGPPTPKVEFSVAHGYKTEPFDVALSCPENPGAAIYYTTDGSSPATTNGILYTTPIPVDHTTVIRAAVPTANALLQYDTSATYIFLDDVYMQSNENRPTGFPEQNEWAPDHFPSNKVVNPSTGKPVAVISGQAIYYGMRSDIVNGPDRDRLDSSFTNGIDTLSIVIDPACLFNSKTGIYNHGTSDGRAWERPMVLECISPTNGAAVNFTIPSGLRIRGGYSRNTSHPKHAFRFYFREDYGEDKLKAPLFGDEGTTKFKKMDLRCSQNYAWAFPGTGDSVTNQDTFVHEVFSRDLQREMGEPYTRSRYYHLFLNGCYWGLYQTQERGDEDFAETYLGGNADDYDLIKKGEKADGAPEARSIYAAEGTIDAWSNLWHYAENEGFAGDNYMKVLGRNPDGTRNPDYPILLDPTNLVVYMLSTHYTADCDTPASMDDGGYVNNIYSMRNRFDDETGKDHRNGFIHLRHDAEHTMGTELTQDKRTKFSQAHMDVTAYGTVEQKKADHVTPITRFGLLVEFNPAELHYRLCENAEYRRLFADLVQKHCLAPDAVMQPERAWALFQSRMDEVGDAIVGEAARWAIEGQTRQTWLDACEECHKFINARLPYMIQHYRDRGWFPSIDAPTLDVAAGHVEPGTVVNFAAKAEDAVDGIYVTTDGSDPAEAGVSATSVTLTDFPCVVKVRAKKGDEWSALTEAEYVCLSADSFYLKGKYDGPQTIHPLGSECTVVLDEATVPGGLVLPGGVKYNVIVSNGVSEVGSISGQGAHIALKGDENGVLKLEGADTLVSLSNLVVKSGALAVTSTGVAADATAVISLDGRFELNGGRVDLDLAPDGCTKQIFGIRLNNKSVKVDGEDIIFAELKGGEFTATVGGVKSAAFKCSKGSVDASFEDDVKVDVTLAGPEARFVNFDGKIKIKKDCDLKVDVSDAAVVTAATAFKAGKEIKISGGKVSVNLPGAESEAFESSNDDGTGTLAISGGTLEVIADDDCFNADQLVTVSGGLIYARSLSNDCFDSNGSMVISGGTILAYATGKGHEAFDVEPKATEPANNAPLRMRALGADPEPTTPEHTLTISGGTIVATGGPDSAWPENLVTDTAVWAETDLDVATYSEKFLTVAGNGTTTTAHLPELTGSDCSLLVTSPGMAADTAPSVSDVGPQTLGEFHELTVGGSVADLDWTYDATNFWHTAKAGTYPKASASCNGVPLVEGVDFVVTNWQKTTARNVNFALGVDTFTNCVYGINNFTGAKMVTPFSVTRQRLYWTNESGADGNGVGAWMDEAWTLYDLDGMGNDADRVTRPNANVQIYLRPSDGQRNEIDLSEGTTPFYSLTTSTLSDGSTLIHDGIVNLSGVSSANLTTAANGAIEFENVVFSNNSAAAHYVYPNGANGIVTYRGTNEFIRVRKGTTATYYYCAPGFGNVENATNLFVDGVTTSVKEWYFAGSAAHNYHLVISNARVVLPFIKQTSDNQKLHFRFQPGADLNPAGDDQPAMLTLETTTAANVVFKKNTDATVDARGLEPGVYNLVTLTTGYDILGSTSPFAPSKLQANTLRTSECIFSFRVVTNDTMQTVQLVQQSINVAEIPVRKRAFAAYTGSPVENPFELDPTGYDYVIVDTDGNSVSPDAMTEVGAYRLTATLKDGYNWSDCTFVPKDFVFAVIDTDRYESVPFVRNYSGYIDTGILLQDNIKADLSFKTTLNKTTSYLLAAKGAANGNIEYLAAIRNADANLYASVGSTSAIAYPTGGMTPTVANNESNRVVVALGTANNLTMTVENERIGSASSVATTGALKIDSQKPLCLLARNNNGKVENAVTSFSLYGATIWTNGNVTAREYLPFFDRESGQYGLYDIASGTFTGSIGFRSSEAQSGCEFTWVGLPGNPGEGEWTNANCWEVDGLGRGLGWPGQIEKKDVAIFNAGTYRVTATIGAKKYLREYRDEVGADLTLLGIGTGTQLQTAATNDLFGIIRIERDVKGAWLFNLGGDAPYLTYPKVYGELHMKNCDNMPCASALWFKGDNSALVMENCDPRQSTWGTGLRFISVYNALEDNDQPRRLALTNSTWITSAGNQEANAMGQNCTFTYENAMHLTGIIPNQFGGTFTLKDSIVFYKNVSDSLYAVEQGVEVGDTVLVKGLTISGAYSKFELSDKCRVTGPITIIVPDGGFTNTITKIEKDAWIDSTVNGNFAMDTGVPETIAPFVVATNLDLTAASFTVDASPIRTAGSYPLIRVGLDGEITGFNPTAPVAAAPLRSRRLGASGNPTTLIGLADGLIGSVESVDDGSQKGVDLVIRYNLELLTATATNCVYSGSPCEPTLTFKDADGNTVTLVKDVDYTVAWENNTDITTNGPAKATITGIGNWAGEIETGFHIMGNVYTWVGGENGNGNWNDEMMWDREGVGIGHSWPDASTKNVKFTNGTYVVYLTSNLSKQFGDFIDDSGVDVTFVQTYDDDQFRSVYTGTGLDVTLNGRMTITALGDRGIPLCFGYSNGKPIICGELVLADIHKNHRCNNSGLTTGGGYFYGGDDAAIVFTNSYFSRTGASDVSFTNDTLERPVRLEFVDSEVIMSGSGLNTLGERATVTYERSHVTLGIDATSYNGTTVLDDSVVGYGLTAVGTTEPSGTLTVTNLVVKGETTKFGVDGDMSAGSGEWLFVMPSSGFLNDADVIAGSHTNASGTVTDLYSQDVAFSGVAPVAVSGTTLDLTGAKLTVDATAISAIGTYPLVRLGGAGAESPSVPSFEVTGLADGLYGAVRQATDGVGLDLVVLKDLTKRTVEVAGFTEMGAEPVVTVTDDLTGETIILKKGVDYVVEYDTSVPGETTVKVIGIGEYFGTVERKTSVMGNVYTWVGGPDGNGAWDDENCWDREGAGIGHDWPGSGDTSSGQAKDTVIFTNGTYEVSLNNLFTTNSGVIAIKDFRDDTAVDLTLVLNDSPVSVTANQNKIVCATASSVTGTVRERGRTNKDSTILNFGGTGVVNPALPNDGYPLLTGTLVVDDATHHPVNTAITFGGADPRLVVLNSDLYQSPWGAEFISFYNTNNDQAVTLAMTNTRWITTGDANSANAVGRNASLFYKDSTHLTGIVPKYFGGTFTIEDSVVGYEFIANSVAKANGHLDDEGKILHIKEMTISGENTKFAVSGDEKLEGSVVITMPPAGFANITNSFDYVGDKSELLHIDTAFSTNAPIAVGGTLDLRYGVFDVDASAMNEVPVGDYPLAAAKEGFRMPEAGLEQLTMQIKEPSNRRYRASLVTNVTDDATILALRLEWAYPTYSFGDEPPRIVIEDDWVEAATDLKPSVENYAAISNSLLTANAFGLNKWQAYVAGFDPDTVKAGNACGYIIALPDKNQETQRITFGNWPAQSRTNETSGMRFRLEESTQSDTGFTPVPGAVSGAPVFDVALPGPAETTKYYRIQIEFRPRELKWFWFKAQEDSTVKYLGTQRENPTDRPLADLNGIHLEYTLDYGMSWHDFVIADTQVSIEKDEAVLLRSKAGQPTESLRDYAPQMTGSLEVGGDIMSLVSQDRPLTIPTNNFFERWLQAYKNDSVASEDTNSIKVLTTARRLKLPATQLTASCYRLLLADNDNLGEGPLVYPAKVAYTQTYKAVIGSDSSMTNAALFLLDKVVGESTFNTLTQFGSTKMPILMPLLSDISCATNAFYWMFGRGSVNRTNGRWEVGFTKWTKSQAATYSNILNAIFFSAKDKAGEGVFVCPAALLDYKVDGKNFFETYFPTTWTYVTWEELGEEP